MRSTGNCLCLLFLLIFISVTVISGCSNGGSSSGDSVLSSGLSSGSSAGSAASGACEGYCYTLFSAAEGSKTEEPKAVLPGYGPAADICVTLGYPAQKAYTDERGYFKLEGIPAGNAALTFTGEGLKTTSLTVSVSENTVTAVYTPDYDAVLIPPGDDSPLKKEWLYICYIASDNDLGSSPSYISRNVIKYMEEVGSTAGMHAVAFIDEEKTNTKMYYIKKDTDLSSISSPCFDYGRNEDSGDYRVFEKFAQQSLAYYPARHHIIDFWNHGSGPALKGSSGRKNTNRDICLDDATFNFISMPQLKESLLSIRTQLGKNIEILVISCCLMGGYETFYQIRDSVDYCIASPPAVWGMSSLPFEPYDVFLERISSNPYVSSDGLAEGLAYDTFREHKIKFNLEHFAYTVVSLAKIGPVHGHFTVFARECNNALSDSAYKTELQALVQKPFTEGYSEMYTCDYNLRDLGLFAKSVSASTVLPQSLKDAASLVASDLETGTQNFKFYAERYNPDDRFDWGKCCLVSIYLPVDDKFEIPPSYSTGLDTSATTDWNSFVHSLWK